MNSWSEQVKHAVKQHVVFGIIAGVLMVVLGIVMIFKPLAALGALLWLLAIGFFVGGIFRIVAYVRMPVMLRQGFSLATGVIDVLCGVMLVVAMAQNPAATDTMFGWFIGFLFGFYALFAGVNALAGSGAVKRMGGSSGWLVASGILEIIAGVLLLFVPMAGTMFIMYLLAFTFIAAGISLFATSLDLKNRVRSLEDLEDRNNIDIDPSDPFNMRMR